MKNGLNSLLNETSLDREWSEKFLNVYLQDLFGTIFVSVLKTWFSKPKIKEFGSGSMKELLSAIWVGFRFGFGFGFWSTLHAKLGVHVGMMVIGWVKGGSTVDGPLNLYPPVVQLKLEKRIG